MKYFLIGFLISLSMFAQERKDITFKVFANNVPDGATIYITGNLLELGSWQPDKVSLINTSGNLWEKSFFIPLGQNVEFKITRGSWNTESIDEKGDIPGNSKLLVKDDTIIEIIINHWKDQYDIKYKGQVTGRVNYFRNIQGEGILQRDIIVWLPPGYETDLTRHYPVLYMQDAQNLFDPATSAFGIDWQLDETADSLIKSGSLKPIIIVGLNNTEWRSSEYADNDTGYAYMNFIINKVKPLIDSAYRTLKDAQNTALGGSSLGALISFILVWNHPDIFSKAICMSPALKISDIDYIKNVKGYNGVFKKLKFYFDAGSDSLDSKLKIGTLEMIKALKSKGYKTGKDILWYNDIGGTHNETSWGKRVWRPLLFFFGNKD